jgi:hemolysin activation/secretion protein
MLKFKVETEVYKKSFVHIFAVIIFILSNNVFAQTVEEKIRKIQIENEQRIRDQMNIKILPEFKKGLEINEEMPKGERSEGGVEEIKDIEKGIGNKPIEIDYKKCKVYKHIKIIESTKYSVSVTNNHKYENKCLGISDVMSVLEEVDSEIRAGGAKNKFTYIRKQDINASILYINVAVGEKKKLNEKDVYELLFGGDITVDKKEVEAKVSKEKNCVKIKQINIVGATRNVHSDLSNNITNKYNNLCINEETISAVLTEINNILVRNGYITSRALLPEQNLEISKALSIEVQMGLIEGVEVVSGGNEINTATIADQLVGKELNIRDIEQMLEQYNRIGSNSVKMKIVPGNKPGYSIVEISNEVKGNKINISASIDNKGSESTGKLRAGVTLTGNNFLNLNESIVIGARSPYQSNENDSNNNNFSLTLPFLYKTLLINGDGSKYKTLVYPASGRPILSEGESKNYSASINQSLYRNAETRINNNISISTSNSKNYIEKQLLTSSSRKQSKVSYELIYDSVLNGGTLNSSIKYTKGIKGFGGIVDKEVIAIDEPHAQFSKIQFDISYSKKFLVFNKM